MARSSKLDPVEKFRFRVTVISVDLSLTALADVVGNFGNNNFGTITRAGFSQVQLPKLGVNAIKYRENIDAARFQKSAGLVTYDPITLSRGVTKNRDLYDWYRIVNDEMALLATAQELSQDSRLSPAQSPRYRKDVIIEVLGRANGIGNESDELPVRGWFLFNAFPVAYKGGNDLDSMIDDKLIEELTLDYEFFVEFDGGVEGFVKELAKGAIQGVAGAAAGFLAQRFGLPIPGVSRRTLTL